MDTSYPARNGAPAGTAPVDPPSVETWNASYFAAYADQVLDPISIPTQIAVLDNELGGGLHTGGVTVIVGAVGSGKTALALQMALGAAKTARERELGPVVFASLEMSAGEIATRLVFIEAGSRLQDDYAPPFGFSDRDRETVSQVSAEIAALPFAISDKLQPRVEAIRALVTTAPRKPSLLVVDHLGLLYKADAGAESRAAVQAELFAELLYLAREQSLPILLLAPLSRKAGSVIEPPTLNDLPVASLASDAGCVIAVHREGIHLPLEERPLRRDGTTPATIAFLKNRWGPSNDLAGGFDARSCRFVIDEIA